MGTLGHRQHVVAISGPGLMQLGQHRRETTSTALILRRKIAAGKKRLEFRGEKQVVGPATTAGHDLCRQHVHGVEIGPRSEEHTSELQSLMRISYAVFCLKKKTQEPQTTSQDSKEKIEH